MHERFGGKDESDRKLQNRRCIGCDVLQCDLLKGPYDAEPDDEDCGAQVERATLWYKVR
jgi:hypothetical protein